MTATAESDPKPTASRSSGAPVAALIVILLALLPLLYVLSIGPIIWLEARNYIEVTPDSLIANFYWPMLQLIESSEFARDIFKAYAELWISDQ